MIAMPSFTIPGTLPSLNEYIRAERGSKYAAAKIKKDATELVAWSAKGLAPIEKYPVTVHCHWVVKNRRKDLDGVRHSIKYVLDGLVMAGVLKNDSWRYISGLSDTFEVGEPRIEVTIKEALCGDGKI